MTSTSSKDSVNVVVTDDAPQEAPAVEAEATFTEITDSTIDAVRRNALPFVLGGLLLTNPPAAAVTAVAVFGGRAVYNLADSILHRNCGPAVKETPVAVEIV